MYEKGKMNSIIVQEIFMSIFHNLLFQLKLILEQLLFEILKLQAITLVCVECVK